MPESDLVYVPCEISRGGFSSERVFRVDLGTNADGSRKTFLGSAPLPYCRTSSGKPLGPDEPPPGKRIPGFVAARVIRKENETAWLSFPDGSVAQVPEKIVETKAGKTPNVSLQS
jgi:hypothetical protein